MAPPLPPPPRFTSWRNLGGPPPPPLLLRPSVRATPPPSFRSRWREGGGDGAIKGERQFPSS